MNVIVVSRRLGHTLQFDLRSPRVVAAAVVALTLVLGTVFAAGSWVGAFWAEGQPARQLARWSAELEQQRGQIASARHALQQNIDALATRVGQMNAHVVRLDALGKRLTEMANLKKGEFNFESAPPVGGGEASAGQPASAPVLSAMLDRLSDQISDRERQMGALENLILTRELRSTVFPQGRPVQEGFISSAYGERVDPFTGYTAFHSGVDFAGEEGSEVMAVATGVVVWAGDKVGYGNLVEINHGDGYVTRYAHNSAILVKVGDTVLKGQALGLLGSSGHSTGPHVHFEVLRDGNPVDPMAFINQHAGPVLRASR
jgi:murein DD-endopeptidase MepM/ murein hydrolase activator NlpD